MLIAVIAKDNQKECKFAIPRIWREPKDHVASSSATISHSPQLPPVSDRRDSPPTKLSQLSSS